MGVEPGAELRGEFAAGDVVSFELTEF